MNKKIFLQLFVVIMVLVIGVGFSFVGCKTTAATGTTTSNTTSSETTVAETTAAGETTTTKVAETGKEIVIIGLAGTYLDPLEKVAKSFTENTGIKVTIIRFPYDSLYEKILLQTKVKKPDVDMFFFDEPMMPFLGSGEHLVALDKEFGYKESDKLFPVLQDLGEWPPKYGSVPPFDKDKERHIYAIPGIANVNILYANEAILKEYGLNPPKTWDDVLEISKKVYDPKKSQYGFVMRGAKGDPITYSYMAMLWSMGGDMFDKDWNPIVNDQASIDAAEMTKKIMEYGPLGWGSYSDTEQAADSISGRAAMGLMWPGGSFLPDMEDSSKSEFAGKFDYLPVPAGKGGSVGCIGTWMLGISAYSDVKKEAYEFIKYFIEDSTANEYAKAGGYPANISAYKEGPNKDLPWSAAMVESLTSPGGAMWTPRTTEWLQVVNTYGTYLSSILTGEMPVKEGLDNAAKDLRTILQDAGYYK